MRRRRGASLVELMVVITLLTAVSAFVGRLLYGLFQAEQSSARDLALDRRLADLAVQFREDVHSAESVRVAGQGTGLECTGPGARRVSYEVEGERLTRKAGTHTEQYKLPGSPPVFRQVGTGAETAIELVVAHPLPQLTFTPSAVTTAGIVVVKARPQRYREDR